MYEETTVHTFPPLKDDRWSSFLGKHPQSSVFHSTPWLQALRRTYGYQPIVVTTTSPKCELNNGIVLCLVDSWVTGRRLVSVPFADHCGPLFTDHEDLVVLVSSLKAKMRQDSLAYIELRPRGLCNGVSGLSPAVAYCLHELDLTPDIDTIFRNFHKDSIQRKILRAEREKLTYEEGRSERMLDIFFELFAKTRRRLGVPPQPKEWFRNLIDCFGEACKIRIASSAAGPIATIFTLRHKDALVYKYGASNPHFNRLGGTQMLFWRTIQEAKAEGCRSLDFGRSAWTNPGLITFKQRWGATSSDLTYFRLAASNSSSMDDRDLQTRPWAAWAMKQVVQYVPITVMCSIGRVFYKHIA